MEESCGIPKQRTAARSRVEEFRLVKRCASATQEAPTSPILNRGVWTAFAMDPKTAWSKRAWLKSPVAAKNDLNSANGGKTPLKGLAIKYGIKRRIGTVVVIKPKNFKNVANKPVIKQVGGKILQGLLGFQVLFQCAVSTSINGLRGFPNEKRLGRLRWT